MTAYERIVELCKARDLTIKQVEKASGIANGTIGRYKNNPQIVPSYRVCTVLSMFFNVPFEYIQTGTIPEDLKDVTFDFEDEFEKMLIEHYRQLSATHKIEVLHLCEKLFNEERQE